MMWSNTQGNRGTWAVNLAGRIRYVPVPRSHWTIRCPLEPHIVCHERATQRMY
jgi:hypothetical protein